MTLPHDLFLFNKIDTASLSSEIDTLTKKVSTNSDNITTLQNSLDGKVNASDLTDKVNQSLYASLSFTPLFGKMSFRNVNNSAHTEINPSLLTGHYDKATGRFKAFSTITSNHALNSIAVTQIVIPSYCFYYNNKEIIDTVIPEALVVDNHIFQYQPTMDNTFVFNSKTSVQFPTSGQINFNFYGILPIM